MNTFWRRPRCITLLVLAVCCALSGCRGVPRTRMSAELANLPPETCGNVQVYLVGSPLDGFELAGLPAIKQHLREVGFNNAEHITWTTPAGLVNRIARDHQQHPERNVVLVGWSLGCLQVLEAASRLESQQLEVDSVICLDGNPWIKLQGVRRRYPQLSEKVVCIYPRHRDLPAGLAQTRQRQVGAWHHFAVPMHEETIETILGELVAVSNGRSPTQQHIEQIEQPHEEAEAEVANVPENAEPAQLPRFATEAMPARQITAPKNWQTSVRQSESY